MDGRRLAKDWRESTQSGEGNEFDDFLLGDVVSHRLRIIYVVSV